MPDVKPDRNSQGEFRKGNRIATTHGVRGFLTTGTLPPKAAYIRRNLNRFRTALEAAVLEQSDKIGLYQDALINSAIRHEARAALLQRWLRINEALTHAEKLATLKEIGNATDSRDRVLKALKLDDGDGGQVLLASLYGPGAVRITNVEHFPLGDDDGDEVNADDMEGDADGA